VRGCAAGAWVAHLPGALQVPLPPLVIGATTSVTAGLSSVGVGAVEPSFKRAHPWSFLPSSSRYACGTDLIFQYFGSPDFEGSVVLMIRTTPCWRQLPVGDRWLRRLRRYRAWASFHRAPSVPGWQAAAPPRAKSQAVLPHPSGP
jgi:hypothetical protein